MNNYFKRKLGDYKTPKETTETTEVKKENTNDTFRTVRLFEKYTYYKYVMYAIWLTTLFFYSTSTVVEKNEDTVVSLEEISYEYKMLFYADKISNLACGDSYEVSEKLTTLKGEINSKYISLEPNVLENNSDENKFTTCYAPYYYEGVKYIVTSVIKGDTIQILEIRDNSFEKTNDEYYLLSLFFVINAITPVIMHRIFVKHDGTYLMMVYGLIAMAALYFSYNYTFNLKWLPSSFTNCSNILLLLLCVVVLLPLFYEHFHTVYSNNKAAKKSDSTPEEVSTIPTECVIRESTEQQIAKQFLKELSSIEVDFINDVQIAEEKLSNSILKLQSDYEEKLANVKGQIQKDKLKAILEIDITVAKNKAEYEIRMLNVNKEFDTSILFIKFKYNLKIASIQSQNNTV